MNEQRRRCKACMIDQDISNFGKYLASRNVVHHSKTCGQCVDDPPVSVQITVTRESGAVSEGST